MKNNGYPEKLIDNTNLKLENLPDDLKEALKKWDATGLLPDIEAQGFSIKELVEDIGLNEIAAFLMIDWLEREPEKAKLALCEPVTKICIDEDCIEEMVNAEEDDVYE